MFYLSLIEHKMLLPPRLLNLPLQDAIKEELQNIFLDKVVTISLCIFLPFCPCIFMLSTLKYWVKMEIIVSMKVISKLGLCISIYDIRKIDGGFISPGEGASTYTVSHGFSFLWLYFPFFLC